MFPCTSTSIWSVVGGLKVVGEAPDERNSCRFVGVRLKNPLGILGASYS